MVDSLKKQSVTKLTKLFTRNYVLYWLIFFCSYLGGVNGSKGWTILEMKATVLRPNEAKLK